MTTRQTDRSISRRTAIAGLGAGGLGLALAAAARPAAAQDAAAEMAAHPIVGLWQFAFPPDIPTGEIFIFSLFHADGTYVSWNGLSVGAALGLWRPTGERTADLLLIYLDADPSPAEVPGTATIVVAAAVDEAGDALAADGTFDLRGQDGSPILNVPTTMTATRVTFDHNPATGSTAATPAAATPTA